MSRETVSTVSVQAKARHGDVLWSVGETAKYLRCSARSVRRYVKQGNLPHRRIAGKLLFRPEEVDRWIDENNPTTDEAA